MDISKLSLQDKIILGAAALLTVSMFLPWFTVKGYGTATSGFDYFMNGTLPWLLAIVMGAQVGLTNFKPDQEIPDLPIPWGKAHLYAGGAAAALIVLRLLVGESDGGGFIEVSRGIGLFLATIAGGGLAYGGFLKSKEEDGGTAGAPPAPPTEF